MFALLTGVSQAKTGRTPTSLCGGKTVVDAGGLLAPHDLGETGRTPTTLPSCSPLPSPPMHIVGGS